MPQPGYLGANSFVPLPEWLKSLMRTWGYSTGQMVLVYSKLALGTDFSQLTPDDVGCAESVTKLLRGVDKRLVPIITGTASLNAELWKSPRFKEVGVPRPGDIIISPTGRGNGRVPNGHVGIVGEDGVIYSNNSHTGKWDKHLTLRGWYAHFGDRGGYPIYYYSYR